MTAAPSCISENSRPERIREDVREGRCCRGAGRSTRITSTRTDGVALILTPPARSPVDRQRIGQRADRILVHAEKGLVRECDAMKLNSGRVRVMDAREPSAARQLRSMLTAFVYRTLRHVDQRRRTGPWLALTSAACGQMVRPHQRSRIGAERRRPSRGSVPQVSVGLERRRVPRI